MTSGKENIGTVSPVPRWEPVDIIIFGYLGCIVALLLIPGALFGQHPRPWPLILLHLALAAVGYGLRRGPLLIDHPVAWVLRWWYPAIFVLLCFEALGGMIHIVQPEYLDPLMVAADRAIFGRMLTPWMQSAASPWLTELMYFCYTSFYLFLPGVGIPLYLRYRRDRTGAARLEFRLFLTAVILAFYFCFLHFLFTPVGGPIFFESYPGEVLTLAGGPITRFEQWLFHHGTIVGGAFPSSHVAAAIVAATFAVRFRVAPWFWAPLSVGLAISTMYNGYHYGVDVIYGLLIAIAAVVAVPPLLRWFDERDPGPEVGSIVADAQQFEEGPPIDLADRSE